MQDESKMLSSKDILLKTKISRATLNNYIRMGILPKPIVKTPLYGLKGPKKIGYFPSHSIDRIEAVRSLKREGFSINTIAARLNESKSDFKTFINVDTRRLNKQRKDIHETPSLFPEMESSLHLKPGERTVKSKPTPSALALPSLRQLCVLHAAIENAELISNEMSPEDYYTLIESILKDIEIICIKHNGLLQHGDFFTAFFISDRKSSYLRNALDAGIELRGLSHLKNTLTNGRIPPQKICLNVGLGFGEEYCAMITGSSSWIFTATNTAFKEARILSGYARGGMLWVSKNILCRLSIWDRRKYLFGVRRNDHFNAQTFLHIPALPLDRESPGFMSSGTILAAEVIEHVQGRKQ